jgi:tRNA (adenine22-N1)-methyltransferase
MSAKALKKRLQSVANLVRCGAVLADIGTDHGHLPIFLLNSGKIKRAICADINEGPLAVAKSNAAAACVCDKIDFLISDGFNSFGEREFTDASICGMGGELILDIIARAKNRLNNENINLILQPMTRASVLRRGLASLGFEIVSESYSSDRNKHYVTMLAHFSGAPYEIDEFYTELGKLTTRAKLNAPEYAYLCAKKTSFEKSATGLLKSGADISYMTRILEKIDEILMLERDFL